MGLLKLIIIGTICFIVTGLIVALSIYLSKYRNNADVHSYFSQIINTSTPRKLEFAAQEILVSQQAKPVVVSEEASPFQIPRIIHMCGTAKLIEPKPIADNIKRVKAQNPNYDFRFYYDEDIKAYIAEHMPPDILTAYSKVKHGVMKADIFRYCAMYIDGGFYFDIKSGSKVPLDEVLGDNPDAQVLIGTWGLVNNSVIKHSLFSVFAKNLYNLMPSFITDGEYMQWFLASRPRHPAFKCVIERVAHHINVMFPSIYRGIDNNKFATNKVFIIDDTFKGIFGIFTGSGPFCYTYGLFDAAKDVMEPGEEYNDGFDKLGIVNIGHHSSLNISNLVKTFGVINPKFPFLYNAAYGNFFGHRTKNHYSNLVGCVVEYDKTSMLNGFAV